MDMLVNAVRLLLAAFMAFMGVQKFGGPNPVFSYIAEQSGMGFFEPGFRMLTGGLELLAAALLVVGVFKVSLASLLSGIPSRMLRAVLIDGWLGAMLSAIVILGAIVFHLSPWLGINAPVAFAESGEGYVFSPFLFVSALVAFALAAFLSWRDCPLMTQVKSGSN